MAGYTIRNLKEIEDSAEQFGLAPALEARFARKELGGDQIGVSYQRLEPNTRIPFGHKHREQEEVYVLLSGSGRIKLDDEVVELRQWDAVRIAKETMRCVESGPDGLELLAIGAPIGEGSDAELTPGWWPA